MLLWAPLQKFYLYYWKDLLLLREQLETTAFCRPLILGGWELIEVQCVVSDQFFRLTLSVLNPKVGQWQRMFKLSHTAFISQFYSLKFLSSGSAVCEPRFRCSSWFEKTEEPDQIVSHADHRKSKRIMEEHLLLTSLTTKVLIVDHKKNGKF